MVRHTLKILQHGQKRKIYVMLKPTTLLKATRLHGRFSHFLNCKTYTELRKTSHIFSLFDRAARLLKCVCPF